MLLVQSSICLFDDDTDVIIYPGFCVEFFFKREKTALLRYANKEYTDCQLADIAVVGNGQSHEHHGSGLI